MKTFNEICNECGTDKGSIHLVDGQNHGHDYARHYERFFAPLRASEIKLLEIGVGGGQSIRAWLEYFSNAQVFGVDIASDTNVWDRPGKQDRYTFVKGDQSDEIFWKSFIVEHGGLWDIVIDDGGHMANQIITSYNQLWPEVKAGGFYCIEDLGVSYTNSALFVPAGSQNHMDFLKARVDDINQQPGIDTVYFARELSIIKK